MVEEYQLLLTTEQVESSINEIKRRMMKYDLFIETSKNSDKSDEDDVDVRLKKYVRPKGKNN